MPRLNQQNSILKPAIFQADISDLHPKPIRVHPSLIETFEFPAKFSPFWRQLQTFPRSINPSRIEGIQVAIGASSF